MLEPTYPLAVLGKALRLLRGLVKPHQYRIEKPGVDVLLLNPVQSNLSKKKLCFSCGMWEC